MRKISFTFKLILKQYSGKNLAWVKNYDVHLHKQMLQIMLVSMTGFGKAAVELQNKKISIEIKSLNSKQLDINSKIPSLYREKDLQLRAEIKNRLERGKIELAISVEQFGFEQKTAINKLAVASYYQQISKLSEELKIPINQESILQHILKLPDSLTTSRDELEEGDWQELFKAFIRAILDLKSFREEEGKMLQKDILERISNIESLLRNIQKYEKKRIDSVKLRIKERLCELAEQQNVDDNRLEQEMIYYLEKMDITEEKVRLLSHCNYFAQTVNQNEPVGKKLAFIAQEIGREINTLGSKANDSDMQKIVIQMKDELEKIKEQILNVL